MLFLLLFVPLLIGLLGLIFSNSRITWKEFLVQEGAVILVIGLGYFIALQNKSADTEIWNGTIVEKHKESQGCCHSYPCNCHESCSGSGKNRSCSTTCDTCYEHSHDVGFYATTSNGETAYSNTCNAPYSWEPSRYKIIKIGEPTAIEHNYQNYIRGNPDTIIKRTGVADKYKTLIPQYPKVFDYYRAHHFISAINIGAAEYNNFDEKLERLNAQLGAQKKVNIIVILTNVADQNYLEALRQEWIGGKKNDIIVVIGAPEFPKVGWSGVLSWTKNEDIKINIRNRLLDLNTFDGNKTLDIVREEVYTGFVHRQWSDYNYLKSTIEPRTWILYLLFIVGVLMSGGLAAYFWYEDPFESRLNVNNNLFKGRYRR